MARSACRALDLLGAGLATTIVNIGMCVAAIWICYARRPFKKYRVLGRFWRADWALMRQLIVVGAPISGSFLLEYGLFAAAALLMGWIGTAALAAHQIALQIAAIMFMVPFGIGMAATVRVGHAVGRRDAAASAARRLCRRSCSGVVFMAAMTLLVALRAMSFRCCSSAARRPIRRRSRLRRRCWCSARASSSPTACRPSRPARCAGSTTRACRSLFAAVSFWLVGFTGCWLFGFTLGLGAVRHLDRLVARHRRLTRCC